MWPTTGLGVLGLLVIPRVKDYISVVKDLPSGTITKIHAICIDFYKASLLNTKTNVVYVLGRNIIATSAGFTPRRNRRRSPRGHPMAWSSALLHFPRSYSAQAASFFFQTGECILARKFEDSLSIAAHASLPSRALYVPRAPASDGRSTTYAEHFLLFLALIQILDNAYEL